MRVPRALLVVLIAALLTAGTVVVAAPSSAGGPTSVLLVNSATGRAAALYTSDPRYRRLSDLLGALNVTPPSTEPAPRSDADGLVGSGAINITWLIHDVQVWRVDRVYVDGSGALIASQSDLSGGSVLAIEPVWHRPSHSKDLLALLNHLGLGAAGAPPSVVPSAANSSPPAAVEEARTPVTSTDGTTAPLWGLAGAVVGAGLVLGLGRVRNIGRRDREADADVEVPSSGDVISY
jgi:hypothetical protein